MTTVAGGRCGAKEMGLKSINRFSELLSIFLSFAGTVEKKGKETWEMYSVLLLPVDHRNPVGAVSDLGPREKFAE